MSAPENRQLSHDEYLRNRRKFPLYVLLDNITVAENVGSIFRLSDALGVSKLILAGATPAPPHKKIAKMARTTDRYVVFDQAADAAAALRRLKEAGFTAISLEVTSASVDVKTVDYGRLKKICLVVGAENGGVSQALLDLSNYTVHIPMLGVNSSMNVATACAVAVFEITRSWAKAGGYLEG